MTPEEKLLEIADYLSEYQDIKAAPFITKASEMLQKEAFTILFYLRDGLKVDFNGDVELTVTKNDNNYQFERKDTVDFDAYNLAGIYLLNDSKNWKDNLEVTEGKMYSREGMIQRVLNERKIRALKLDYKIVPGDSVYGEYLLTDNQGKKYKVTIRDFGKKYAYIDNIDWKTNKLGQTKHTIYLFDYLEKNKHVLKGLSDAFPFVEITLDPFENYAIRWFYIGNMGKEEKEVIQTVFGDKTFLEQDRYWLLLYHLKTFQSNDRFRVRSEVLEKLDRFFKEKSYVETYNKAKWDYSNIKADLFPYQKKGVEFALPKSGAVIADEMGLGKTLQAIAVASLKKKIFGFANTLIICPSSLKYQWKSEIEKFTNLKAEVVEGRIENRKEIYKNSDAYFLIINYEKTLRDIHVINSKGFDFVILDEAQKIKNYETKVAEQVKKIKKEHGLVLTGTPIENKLIDLYSIMQFVDPRFLAPLWEFSYQHCLFDLNTNDKIVGYYNLNELRGKLKEKILRRQKIDVLNELPNVNQKNIFLALTQDQEAMHGGMARTIAQILGKKFKTQYDWQKLMLTLNNMRMVCNSSFLVDKTSHFSSKLYELPYTLNERLDLKNNKKKVIIFSEWIVSLNMIAEVLKKEGYGYTMFTGRVPSHKRGKLIAEFEQNDDCRIFLSTESGGAGLNLQVADTLINFELPWNPAKKNQRIGRIDRIGQQNKNLTVINYITTNSIETSIMSGLQLKQNLFEGVLNEDSQYDFVDFSQKGKSQFLKKLEELIGGQENGSSIDIRETEFEEIDSKETSTEEETFATTELEENFSENQTPLRGETKQTTELLPSDAVANERQPEEMEEVLNKGMEFLSGLYKMSTGKEMFDQDKKSIKINKDTGEVTLTFKMKM